MGPQLIIPITLGSITTTSTSNSASHIVICPIRVLQIGFIVTAAPGTTAPVLTWNVLKADGSTDVSPTGAAVLGTTTATSATQAVGTGVYLDVSAVKGNRVFYPGELIQAKVSTASTSTGTVTAFMLAELLGFNNADMRTMYTSHPGTTTYPLALSGMTKVIA